MLTLLLLLLLSLSADALVIEFDIHSVVRENQPKFVASLMDSFTITKENLEVVAGMLSSSPELEYHYCNRYETAERVDELLLYTHFPSLHEKVYGLCKLALEARLAEEILLEHGDYQINIHKPLQDLRYIKGFTDHEIQHVLLKMMKEQIMEMQDPANITTLLKQYIQTADPMASFTEFLPVMTPELLVIFLDPYNAYFETFSALAALYVTEFDSGPEHTIRNLLVLQACRDIYYDLQDSPLAVSAMEVLMGRSSLESNDEMEAYRMLLRALNAMTQRTDISYWSTLVDFALYVDSLEPCQESQDAFAAILSEGHGHLPPLYMQKITARCENHTEPEFRDLLYTLNPVQFSFSRRSVEEKREAWLDKRVMQMFSGSENVSKTKNAWDSFIYWELSRGPLPTNFTCIVDGKAVGNFGDWIISRAEDIVMDGSYTHKDISQLNMSIIVMSWAYLIWEGKRLNFGTLFDDVSSWKKFSKKMKGWIQDRSALSAFAIMERVRSIGLEPLFTPQEIKSLVNLGNSEESEAISNSGPDMTAQWLMGLWGTAEFEASSDGELAMATGLSIGLDGNGAFEASSNTGSDTGSDSGSDMDLSY